MASCHSTSGPARPGHTHTHPLAVLSLHVHEVGGVKAAVHAFLVPGDSTFNGDAARRRSKHKLLQVGDVDESAVGCG